MSSFVPYVHADDALQYIAHIEALTTVHEVDYDDTRVRWRSAGHGTPLVLLHGGHGTWLHWVRNIEALAARHTLWLPDMPSFGASGTLAEPRSLEHLVAVTAGSLDLLVGAGTEVDLAGFSFGGLCAATLASHRGGIGRLALLGSAGHGTTRRPMTPLVNWRLAQGEAALREDLHHNLQALMLHDAASIDELAMAIHRDACATTRFRSKALSYGNPVKDLLDGMDIPMLFLWGDHDVTGYADRIGPWWTEGHAGRAWQVVAGAGHWVQYERPDETNRALLDFLRR